MRRTWNHLLHLLLLLPCAAAMCAEEVALSNTGSARIDVESPFEVSYIHLESGFKNRETTVTFILREDDEPVAEVILTDKNDILYSVQSGSYKRRRLSPGPLRTDIEKLKLQNPVKLSLSYSDGFFNVSIYKGEQTLYPFSRLMTATNGTGRLSVKARARGKYVVFLPCNGNTDQACWNFALRRTFWLFVIMITIFVSILAIVPLALVWLIRI